MTQAHAASDPNGRSIWSPGDTWLLGVIACVDVGCVAFWTVGLMTTPQAIATHLLTTLLVLLPQMVVGQDRLRHVMMAVLYALMGPPGCPALFVARNLPGLSRQLDASQQGLAAKNFNRSSAICEAIRQNRRHHPIDGTAPNFQRSFRSGSAKDHHAVIATLSRKYSHEMRPALDLALQSPNAALRVQAAAVFAKLRSSYSDRATEAYLAIQENRRGEAAAELAKEARAVALSGFVAEEHRRHLLAAARLLDQRALKKPSNESTVPAAEPEKRSARDIKRYSCGGVA